MCVCVYVFMYYLHYELPNYTFYYIDRTNKQGGGVALYVHNRFRCRAVSSISYEYADHFEIVTVELNLQGQTNVLVSCCYRNILTPVNLPW